MTTYERAIKQGRRLTAWRKIVPVAVITASVGALMIDAPFRLIGDSIWLVSITVVLAAVAFWLRAEAGKINSERMVEGEGIFSAMRFPVIASNLLLIASAVLYTGSVAYMIFTAMVCLPSAYCVILAQEHTLQSRYGDAFIQWCRTTYAITPHPLNYRPLPAPHPSTAAMLMRQIPLVTLWTACLLILSTVKNLRINFEFSINPGWLAVFDGNVRRLKRGFCGKRRASGGVRYRQKPKSVISPVSTTSFLGGRATSCSSSPCT